MSDKLSSLADLAAAFGKLPVQKSPESSVQDSSLVYSTDQGRIKQTKSSSVITESDGFAKLRRETKGRKGKGVITIRGLGLDPLALKLLAKKLKKICGTGGTVIDEVIEIQGDKRDIITATLKKEGFKVKFTGG